MKLDFRAKLSVSQKRTTTMIVNALYMLLTKKSFDEITVREICKISLIPHSTFYNYFEDKYDVVKWSFYAIVYNYYPEMDEIMNHYDNIEKSADLLYDFIDDYCSSLKIRIRNSDMCEVEVCYPPKVVPVERLGFCSKIRRRDRNMRKRFTEEQIVAILQEQQNSGRTVAEVARKNGISENTFYIWKRKYANMTVSEVTRLRGLEEENARLKRLVADLSLENMVQKDVIKNFCSPK